MSGDEALEVLLKGNEKYIKDSALIYKNLTNKMIANRATQKPLAVVITCSDSRVPVELLFHQDIGKLFVIRVAGNVLNDEIIGSVEYATKYLGVKLVMVMAHSHCGLIAASTNKQTKFSKYITTMTDKVIPVIKDCKCEKGSEEYLSELSQANAKHQSEKLKELEEILQSETDKRPLKFVSAYYCIETGKVEII